MDEIKEIGMQDGCNLINRDPADPAGVCLYWDARVPHMAWGPLKAACYGSHIRSRSPSLAEHGKPVGKPIHFCQKGGLGSHTSTQHMQI
jgi:hypothetical protein